MKKLITLLALMTYSAYAGQLTQTTAETQQILDDASVKAGVFAVLTTSSNTTCTADDTWYAIQGVFTNKVFEGFTISGTNIACAVSSTNQYEIDWHATLSCDNASTTPSISVKINDTVQEAEAMTVFCKNASQAYTVSGTVVIPLTSNDTVQLVCKSDGAGDVLTFQQFVTSLTKFFVTRD